MAVASMWSARCAATMASTVGGLALSLAEPGERGRAPLPRTSAAGTAGSEVTGPRAGKRVLVAEDDLEMRQVVREVLEAAGFEVHEASSGVALLAQLAEDGDFDLVVTDVRMPWISGEHVVRMARRAGFAMPVLIMTAYADEALEQLLDGVPDVILLEKPFDLQELVEAARRFLGTS